MPVDGNLNSSRWAPATVRSQSANTRPTANFHNILSSSRAPPFNEYTPSRPPPTTPAIAAAEKRYTARHSSLERYNRLFRRLRHKSLLLLASHHHALVQSSSAEIGGLQWGIEPGEAETMFRVDFFEWYVLLERCLVEALAGVGIAVSAGYDPLNANGNDGGGTVNGIRSGGGGGGGIIGDSNAFRYGHRFHANVLAALDSQDKNPLFCVLGQGVVRQYIGVAKEFRNKWKDVESTGGVEEDEEEMKRRLRRYEKIMNDLKLDDMLACILQALEAARQIVEQEVSSLDQERGVAGTMNKEDQTEVCFESEPWEASADTMELG